jgi:hypothetical protein
MKITTSWDVMPCSPAEVYQCSACWLLGIYSEDISEQHDVTAQNLILLVVTAVRTPEYLESICFANCLFVLVIYLTTLSVIIPHSIHLPKYC